MKDEINQWFNTKEQNHERMDEILSALDNTKQDRKDFSL